MASALYPKWKEALVQNSANSDLDGSGTTGVYAAIVTNAYTYSGTHEFYSSLSGVLSTDQELSAGKTYTDGVFDSSTDPTWTSVAGGSTINAVILYRKTAGANTEWRLVAYLDSGNITGLPCATNGGNITVTWHASGIFAL